MKKINKLFSFCLAIILALGIQGQVWSQQAEGGTESNLSLGYGGRAMGMGQAFTALADDPTAVFWNPAGLEYVYQQSITLFHSTLFEGTLYDFLGYAYPTLSLGTFGFGLGRIGTGGIVQRDASQFELGTFSWDEYQAYFSYAKRLPWNLTPGITVRVVRRAFSGLVDQGRPNDNGVGMDLGLMYRPDMFSSLFLRDWSLGFNIRNLFTPQLKEGNILDELPLSIRFGLMRKIYIGAGGSAMNVLFDVDYSEKRSTRFHFGAEYEFRNLGMLRAGYDGSGLTFGAGVKYKIFQIDYAFGNSPYGGVLPSLHRFSLSVNFGLNRDQLSEIALAKRKEAEEKLIAAIREKDRQKFVTTHLQTADKYFEQGKFLDAVVEYQQVISQDPFNTRAKIMLDSSDVMLNREMEQERSLAVKNAIDKERAENTRKFVQTHFEKGRLYLDKNQFTEALMEFNLALEQAPEDKTIQNAINTTKRRMAEEVKRLVNQGRKEFQQGNYAKALSLLADARLLGGDNQAIQKEIDTLSKRIKLQENIQKGLGLFEIGQYDQAANIFEEALKINPQNKLARQYYEKSKIETSGKQEKLDPASERRFLEGVDLFIKGKYRQAISVWEEILKKYPYNKKVLKAIKGARERLNRK